MSFMSQTSYDFDHGFWTWVLSKSVEVLKYFDTFLYYEGAPKLKSVWPVSVAMPQCSFEARITERLIRHTDKIENITTVDQS